MVKWMDLELETNVQKVAEILKAIGFNVIKTTNTIEARLQDGWGRIHVLGIEIDKNKTYLDIHRDAPIHMAFIGVDYAKKPARANVLGRTLVLLP
jgi:hypothetical protein